MAVSAISSSTQAAQTAQASNASNVAAVTKKVTPQEAVAQLAKTDTVTISKKAAQLAYQPYSQKEELKETLTQKTKESALGKK